MSKYSFTIILVIIISGCNQTRNNSSNSTSEKEANYSNFTDRVHESFPFSINWEVDSTHSSVLFSTKHTEVHEVIGWLLSYKININSSRHDFSDGKISAVFNMASIQMPNMEMADNVMSPLFMDAQKFPTASYISHQIDYYDFNKFKIHGDLTLKGVTKRVDLDARFNGYANWDLHGLPGFTVTGKFSRFDFDMENRDTLIPSGVPLVDDTIHITGNFRLYANIN